MKKFFLFCMMALVGMCGLNSCSDDCDHDFIEVDYSKDIVGTWTYLAENGQAEAMVIKADGSFAITGVSGDLGLYEETGTIKLVNNKVTLAYASGDVFEGLLELVTGKSMSIVFNKEYDICLTYDYCENDLSDEILGMWVCNNSKMDAENDIMIQTYDDKGNTHLTGFLPMGGKPEYVLDDQTDYKVVGDLMFLAIPAKFVGGNEPKYIAERMKYAPMATILGDVMTFTNYSNDTHELLSERWIRIKQHLDLAGKKYNYTKTFVTNAKGMDKDIPFLNASFNFAKMDGSIIDKFLKSTLFSVEFPGADEIKYNFLLDDKITSMTAPIEVDGNKMTIKMSANNPAYQDVEIYTFQDQDNTQMHLFMPTTSFEKFFANTAVTFMLGNGQLDKNDTEAIADVYQAIANAVESINLSLVMHSSK